MKSIMSVKDVATKLELTDQAIRMMCRNGKLKGEFISNSWIITSKELDIYMSKHKVANHSIKNMKDSNKPKLLSFFSGAMGLDLGLEAAGFECLLACEVDKHCRATINKNKPEMALLGDIRNYSSEEIMNHIGRKLGDEIDVICGGPPCQAFSTAGNRKSFEDERGNVFLKYIEIAMDIKPKFFVIENVRGLLSAPLKHRPHNQRGEDFPPLTSDEEKGGALLHIFEVLKDHGYGVSFELYSSANFGVPQIRERVIMICSRDGSKAPYIEPSHSEDESFDLKPWVTFKDLHIAKDFENINHDHVQFPEKRLKYYRQLKAGENWKNLPLEMQKEAMGKSFYSGGGKSGFLRRISWNRPSPTVVTHPAMPATDLCHPIEERPLSVQEYKGIQQFPDDWIIEGKILDQYKQIGNAVPVGLGKALGTHLIKLINGEVIKTIPSFRYSRYKNTSEIEWFHALPKTQTETN
jgi:DNA (cytosine-5)-methyltransferase 1